MTLNELNNLHAEQASDWFAQTCAATRWCAQMTANRPYLSVEEVLNTAQSQWQTMQKADFLQAFLAHPMIGDVDSLRAKYANTKAMASHEQSGTAVANEGTLLALRDENIRYADKHGFIFIICATGLSAETMLAALKARVDNDTETELANAAAEQIKITLLRLQKGLVQTEENA